MVQHWYPATSVMQQTTFLGCPQNCLIVRTDDGDAIRELRAHRVLPRARGQHVLQLPVQLRPRPRRGTLSFARSSSPPPHNHIASLDAYR